MGKNISAIVGLVLLLLAVIIVAAKCSFDLKKTAKDNECTRKMKEMCPNCILDYSSFTPAIGLNTNQCVICGHTETKEYCVSKDINAQITISENGQQKRNH